MEKYYLTTDLAAELGVPRTTVNDWLARYAAYLDFELRGKRRMYSSRALAVLRDVARLREAGQSAPEIENELERLYGVHPEIAPESAPGPAPATESPPAAPPAGETGLARLDNAELTRLIAEFNRQDHRRESVRRIGRFLLFGIFLLLLFLLVIATLTGAFLLRKISESRTADMEKMARVNAGIDSVAAAVSALKENQQTAETAKQALEEQQRQELEKIAVTLDRARKDYEKNLRNLTAELEKQREEALRAREVMSEEAKTKYQVELVRLKEEFAARQLELLKQLEDENIRRRAAEEALRSAETPPPAETPAEQKKTEAAAEAEIEKKVEVGE